GMQFWMDPTYSAIKFDGANWRLLWNRTNGRLSYYSGGGTELFMVDGGGTGSFAASLAVSGGITGNQSIYAANQLTADNIMSRSGAFYIGNSAAHYFARSSTDNHWRVVENNVVLTDIAADGS